MTCSRSSWNEVPISFTENCNCKTDTVSGFSEDSQGEARKGMTAVYGKDIQAVIQAELEENEKVRALVRSYGELTEADRAFFRLVIGISQDATSNSTRRRSKPKTELDSQGQARPSATSGAKSDENATRGLPHPTH